MLNLFLNLLALFALLLGCALAYLRWVRPRQSTLGFQSTGLMLLLVTTMMGGLLGAPFWWLDMRPSFAWDLPPLASRMLGAAGLSFAVVSLIALRSPRRRPVRLVLVLLVVYLAPLVAAALLWHRDRFDFAASITYGFFAIAGGMTIASLWYCLRQPICMPDLALPGPPSALAAPGCARLQALPACGDWRCSPPTTARCPSSGPGRVTRSAAA